MKYVPKRAEICTIKDILYPKPKKKDTTWKKKNLEDLKELEEKIQKEKFEKQQKIENLPEPFKIKQFKNVHSKLKSDTENWVNNKQKSRILYTQDGSENIYMQNEMKKNKSNFINKSSFIKKLPNLPSNFRLENSNSNKNLHENNLNAGYNENEFNIEKELEKIDLGDDDKYYPSLFERPKSNREEIEQLIKEYKEKYGDTETIESLIKEYNEIKQPKNNSQEENIYDNINKDLNNNINNQSPKSNNKTISKTNKANKSSVMARKDDIPKLDDVPLILPKINKNYVLENIQLITENKIPQKKINETIVDNKHRNYGKIPEYIKKYEMERELQKEELKRRKEEMTYPKGTKLLTEEERVNTLSELLKAQKDLNTQLEKMPITTRTLAVKNKKEELIRKLDEIEKAIELFSKKKVFVKK